MKICFTCNTLFDRHFDIGLEKVCPVKDCFGEVVEIDDNIFETIKILNEKGYFTDYSCSGHLWHCHPFISFDERVSKRSFTHLPKKFYQEMNSSKVLIRRSINTSEILKMQKELNEVTYDLLDWAIKLPQAKRLYLRFNNGKNANDDQFIKTVENDLKILFYAENVMAGDSCYFFESYTTPANAIVLSKLIKEFAKKKKLLVEIEISDYEDD